MNVSVSTPLHTEGKKGSNTQEIVAGNEDTLDWEACLPVAPQRRAGMVQVKLQYKGRAKPAPVADPNDEAN